MKRTMYVGAALVLSLWVAAPMSYAQTAQANAHQGHGAATAAPAPQAGTARQALDQSMVRMHDDMMRGIAHDDADVAFAAGMLAHHEGAVEMARIQLQYGKDATLRKLSEEVIRAQEAEITLLKGWLAERGLAADGHPVKKQNPHAGH